MCTTMSALAATSMVSVPSVAEPFSPEPCALTRTTAHHSEGLDTWNTAYPRPTRSMDAVMVFLSFPDSHPLTTPAELTADHFPATSRFFQRASYGRFTLRPHPLRQWIRMPRPSTSYAIERDWTVAHRGAYLRDALAAADPHVDFSRYDIVYFVADPDAPGVDSDATKVVNLDRPLRADGTDIRRVVTVFENHPPDRLVLAHETGHVFDLPDLYHRPVDGKGDWDTHVGDWDLMGSQFALAPDLFGWHKWKLGWLDSRQVRCVQETGPVRLTLEPLGAGPGIPVTGAAGAPSFGLGRGTKLAVVRTGPDSVLAFEARGPVGNDRAACRQGVLVYRVSGGTRSGRGPIEVVDAHPHTEACWSDSVYPPLADAPVALGESFTVPGESVRVEVEDRTASGAWTVRITTG
ncbi:M6 family metalloprotease domain-containing protein [Streptomyces edwardsiae]|uniref:M6 family metalloprotease domain-containing protein n=1 Tax=Streptomyces edwardsiae TaxID=3075527 RepID=A0ABU2QHK3_9ACTN|nr:M6 family metalloprotease domain-containing protein [Streptomyces sp. DSM 41635]MDT0403896.1 M6 family metalloprotease domain-containing protein [Streptomyces sp. DSM 41635]